MLKELLRHVDVNGDRDVLLRWYQDDKDRIVYDPASRRFGLPKTAAP